MNVQLNNTTSQQELQHYLIKKAGFASGFFFFFCWNTEEAFMHSLGKRPNTDFIGAYGGDSCFAAVCGD
jgi:hypothetical protein